MIVICAQLPFGDISSVGPSNCVEASLLQNMTANIRAKFRQMLEAKDWMDNVTKSSAIEKLDGMVLRGLDHQNFSRDRNN